MAPAVLELHMTLYLGFKKCISSKTNKRTKTNQTEANGLHSAGSTEYHLWPCHIFLHFLHLVSKPEMNN